MTELDTFKSTELRSTHKFDWIELNLTEMGWVREKICPFAELASKLAEVRWKKNNFQKSKKKQNFIKINAINLYWIEYQNFFLILLL